MVSREDEPNDRRLDDECVMREWWTHHDNYNDLWVAKLWAVGSIFRVVSDSSGCWLLFCRVLWVGEWKLVCLKSCVNILWMNKHVSLNACMIMHWRVLIINHDYLCWDDGLIDEYVVRKGTSECLLHWCVGALSCIMVYKLRSSVVRWFKRGD